MIRKHLCIPCSGCPLGGLSQDLISPASDTYSQAR